MTRLGLCLAALGLALCIEAPAQLTQTISPIPAAQPVAPPAELFEKLMPLRQEKEDSDSRVQGEAQAAADKAQATALEALGIRAELAAEARLVLEDLDGDGLAEALFTVNLDGADVVLVVLKRKGNQWYRLPSPEGFDCWCKYEHSPLDTFVEVQEWRRDFEETGQPRRLIFLRTSGGGTGLYERNLQLVALLGDELRTVFSTIEARAESDFPDGHSELQHVNLTIEHAREPALVAREFRRRTGHEQSLLDESWWLGLPPSKCSAYTWNAKDSKFQPSPTATSTYCGRKSSARKPARP